MSLMPLCHVETHPPPAFLHKRPPIPTLPFSSRTAISSTWRTSQNCLNSSGSSTHSSSSHFALRCAFSRRRTSTSLSHVLALVSSHAPLQRTRIKPSSLPTVASPRTSRLLVLHAFVEVARHQSASDEHLPIVVLLGPIDLFRCRGHLARS